MALVGLLASAVCIGTCHWADEKQVVGPVHIVDVRADRVTPHGSIVIQGQRITSIDPAPPGEAGTSDQSDLYAIPGLFDCHVHLNEPDRDARLMIAYGVVMARDMGGSTGDRVRLRERAKRDGLFGLSLKVTGTLLDGAPPYHLWAAVCDTPEQGRAAARTVAAAGVDQIKVYSRLKPEVHDAILDEARTLGLRCVGHVPDSMTILDAARAGQASNEHLQRAETLFLPLAQNFEPPKGSGFIFGGGWWGAYPGVDKTALDARLRDLAGTGMVQCPTLVMTASYGRIPVSEETLAAWNRFVPPSDVQAWITKPEQWGAYVDSAAQAWPSVLDLVGRLHATGNTIIVGTDLANPYALAGYSVHEEMGYLQQAGLSNAECLRAATMNAAAFLGVDTDLGTIEPGKLASFVLVEGNPLDAIHNTRKIREVWVKGRRYDGDAIERLKAEAAELTGSLIPGDPPASLTPLAGTVIGSHSYLLKYQDWEIGTEDFEVARLADGFSTRTISRLKSYGQVPAVVESRHSMDGALRTIEWTSYARVPSRGTLRADDRAFELQLLRGGTMETNNGEMALDAFVNAPLGMGAEIMLCKRLVLAVGEARDVSGYEPQLRSAQALPAMWTVRRLDDEEAQTVGGAKVRCSVYTITRTDPTDGGMVTLWIDSDGVPVKRVSLQGSLTQSAIRR
ncbi:MAG: amidohydrolase family protein [Phycisphaerae bacterium]|nr:amidohydrolase family protein [Phycisphaerae bacterium]